MNLEDITQKEEFVLFDTSIIELGQYFLRDIFPKNTYSQINYDDIVNAQKVLKHKVDFIDLKNTFVIKEVIEELSILQEKLNNKAINFNEAEKKYKNLLKKKKVKISDTNKEEYTKLLEITHDLIQKAKKKIIKLKEKERYNVLYNSILNINKILNLTINPKWYSDILNKQPRIFQKEKKDLKTDEHLTATLFYLSIENNENNKSYALITRDNGIVRLTNEFYKLICADKSYSCQCLKEELIKTPIRIYSSHPPGSYNYKLKFSSRDPYTNYELYKEREKIKKLKKKKERFNVIKF